MSQTLRASVLATITAGVMAFAPDASAAGRGDWKDYAWQKFDVAQCVADGSGELACPAYHQKWDWKRNQWVDITISIRGNSLSLVQQLTDNDRKDDDYVCVTVLVLDGSGRDLIAHHQNWQITAGEKLADTFEYTSSRLSQANTIHIGSKQCRNGAGQDDATYARVLGSIRR